MSSNNTQAPSSSHTVSDELTFDLIQPPVVVVPTEVYEVGCFITSPANVVSEATPEEFGDAILHVNTVWGDTAPVVTGMRKTYKSSEVSNPTTGSIAAYESAQCPSCRRLYSGADIEAHLHTHTASDLLVGVARLEADMSERAAYVAQNATGVGTSYKSEGEGLSDTTTLTDAHVREDGMFLTVEVEVAPVGKCECMYGDVSENTLVTSRGIEGGKAYKCVHGTQWNEVWETTYTHARWDHLRDAHLQEATYNDNIGHFGSNPIYAYLSRQAQTRKTRCADIAQWIQRAPLRHVIAQRKSDTLKVRRNATVAAAVGFDATPVGKWDGVSGSDICGLVRHTEVQIPYIVTSGELIGDTVVSSATCTRIADWSSLYLTKAQFQYLTLLMTNRVNGKNSATPAAKSLHEVVAPTRRAVVAQERTPGDVLLQSRLFAYTMRKDAERWAMSGVIPQVSKGVPPYVNSGDVAELDTLGYSQA